MAFHKEEIPTGVIDGVNKVFTLSADVFQIVLVVIDGALYTGGVTYAGNQITLSDAPTASVKVTYYDSVPEVIASATGATVQESIDRMVRHYNYDLQATNGGEVSFDLFLDWLNDLNYMIYEKLLKIDPSKYWQTAEFTKTDVNLVFDKPSNLKSYNHSELGMHKVDGSNNTLDEKLDEIALGEQKAGFYSSGTQFVFSSQTPNEKYRFYYAPVLPELTQPTDKLVIDKEYLLSILDYLDGRYGKWNVDITKETNADSRFNRELDRILNNFSPSVKYYTL